jgi:hypothetical protein
VDISNREGSQQDNAGKGKQVQDSAPSLARARVPLEMESGNTKSTKAGIRLRGYQTYTQSSSCFVYFVRLLPLTFCACLLRGKAEKRVNNSLKGTEWYHSGGYTSTRRTVGTAILKMAMISKSASE